MRPTAERAVTIVLLVAAFGVSSLLLARSLALAAGTAGAGDVCSALFERGCDATLRDPSSHVGGIPLAAWGAIHFATVLGLLALGRVLGAAVRDAAASAAALLAVVGGLASAALVVSLVVGAVPLCPMCLVANGLNLAAVVPVVRWTGRPMRAVVADWRGAARWLTGGAADDPAAVPLRVTGFACTALVAVVLYQWVLIEWDRARTRGKEVDPARVVAAFDEAHPVEVPVDPDDPVVGPATARSTLVVFSDAYCSACRGFWAAVPRLAARHGDGLRVVFKHFPLDPPCNATAKAAVHPYACNAGLALEAARRQGKFWAYQDVLAAPEPRTKEDVFSKAAAAAGLDLAQFRTDMSDAALRARLERDVALGARLGVTATPTMFLDGRRVEDVSPKALEILLAHVLGKGAATTR